MRVLVTGATGYIGSVVAEALAPCRARGRRHRANRRGRRRLEGRGIEPVRADLRSPETLAGPAGRRRRRHPHGGDAGGRHGSGRAGGGRRAARQRHARSSSQAASGCTAARRRARCWTRTPSPIRCGSTRGGRRWSRRCSTRAGSSSARAWCYGRGGGPMNQFAEHGGRARRAPARGRRPQPLVDRARRRPRRPLPAPGRGAPPGTLLNGITGEPIEVRELAAAACAGAGAPRPVEWPRDDAAHELGYTMAEALTRDHRISGARAREHLGWRPPERSPLEELRSASA